ncbi:predicted protein [Naegleria gruberi]|uniref:Predicted protein n=1 Tax=Naegleria gruberi TaxID=5762 RepID=D2VI95_NAEGR|nr:uncharacterized protein NAEGRDRAFT_49773 [Naegleria gruberi]EFC43557.1 predicted protein [Naegleria gruberi]|eukprot:XP_002676301.1 predicted protein [Naegleria gruberi strain NEG-M]
MVYIGPPKSEEERELDSSTISTSAIGASTADHDSDVAPSDNNSSSQLQIETTSISNDNNLIDPTIQSPLINGYDKYFNSVDYNKNTTTIVDNNMETHHARKLDRNDEDEYLDFLEKSLEEEQKFITSDMIESAEQLLETSSNEKERAQSSFTLAILYVKSGNEALIHKGIKLLESILRDHSDIFNEIMVDDSSHYKRDCLYLISLGFFFLRDYAKAESAVAKLLDFDYQNEQGLRLKSLIKRKKKKVERDGMIGLALAGGASLAIGGVLGLGVLALGLLKAKR